MGLRALLFIGLFASCCVGAFYAPIWPLLGYVADYCIGPGRQWWYGPIRPLGIRSSFTLAALTALGLGLHWNPAEFGNSLLCRHEKLLLAFLGVVWFSVLIGSETVGMYTRGDIDHPSVKFTKIAIFTLLLSHVVTDFKNLNRLIWVLILSAMVLGKQALDTPLRAFTAGRLESVGGPDFGEANFFGAFMATVLWIIGVQFLRSGWRGKMLCFVAGGFAANAMVLTRSRGALVGLVCGGLAGLVMAPRRYRGYLAVGLVVAGAGFLYLSDQRFLDRALTVFSKEEERDTSAEARIILGKAGLRMWLDHPQGVGVGNFFQTIGRYAPTKAGKDAHNTYIRCLTELGLQGFVLFGVLFASALFMLHQIRCDSVELPSAEQNSVILLSLGMTCALATMLGCFLTMSLTYVEFVWWFLMLPVCLRRALDNARLDAESSSDELPSVIDSDSVTEQILEESAEIA